MSKVLPDNPEALCALVASLLNNWNREGEVLSAYFDEDVVLYHPAFDEPVQGREEVQSLDAAFLSAFPDAHKDNIRVYKSCLDPIFVAEFEIVGTHKGVFRGIEATGRVARIPCTEVFEAPGGIVETIRRYLDTASYGRQLQNGSRSK